MGDEDKGRISDDSIQGQICETDTEKPKHITFSLDDYHIDPTMTYNSIGSNDVHVTGSSVTPSYKSKSASENSSVDLNETKKSEVETNGGRFTRRQLIIFSVYAFTQFFSAAIVSLQVCLLN